MVDADGMVRAFFLSVLKPVKPKNQTETDRTDRISIGSGFANPPNWISSFGPKNRQKPDRITPNFNSWKGFDCKIVGFLVYCWTILWHISLIVALLVVLWISYDVFALLKRVARSLGQSYWVNVGKPQQYQPGIVGSEEYWRLLDVVLFYSLWVVASNEYWFNASHAWFSL